MRDDRVATADRRSSMLLLALAGLASWLVIQNGLLFLMAASPLMPAALTVARALLKVAVALAMPLAPVALLAGGAWLLWAASRRNASPGGRNQEVLHG